MAKDVEGAVAAVETDEADLVSRPPVVTVMGHVDHGKTSLLDALRELAQALLAFAKLTDQLGIGSLGLR